ncbi:hypothetical protein EVAR_35841_1 [Eumeta japonica]|uniref:Uncharacterized protein n=1 Tax=Eumeta variegata TaxID=151549 RepID=A0A4C1WVR2_EUMVA|nr:hypothetical protein EVAR_35841_1 [Eumeta japonica]
MDTRLEMLHRVMQQLVGLRHGHAAHAAHAHASAHAAAQPRQFVPKLKRRQNYSVLEGISDCIKSETVPAEIGAAGDAKTRAKLILTIDSSLYVHIKSVQTTHELSGLTEKYSPMIMAIEHCGILLTADAIKTKLLDMEENGNGGATETGSCSESDEWGRVNSQYLNKMQDAVQGLTLDKIRLIYQSHNVSHAVKASRAAYLFPKKLAEWGKKTLQEDSFEQSESLNTDDSDGLYVPSENDTLDSSESGTTDSEGSIILNNVSITYGPRRRQQPDRYGFANACIEDDNIFTGETSLQEALEGLEKACSGSAG